MPNQPYSPDSFQTFGDLLKYLRRRERLTQLELSITVGYSEAQISRLEQNQRLPDLAALKALFIPALHLENEPVLSARFLELAQSARQEDAPAPGIAPYKGLLFFDEADADLFFGREALTTRLADRVADLASESLPRFLAVVGASGSGKSSLVRAGLVVALKRAGWETRIFTPTADPLKALEMQLNGNQARGKSERFLLLVDQFEETFTLCREESVRIKFIDQLLKIAQRKPGKEFVVITLRADFYSHCAQYPLLREAVASKQEYIGQMTTDELRRTIEEPARHGGWEFEAGLVDVLLNDIGADGLGQPEPGALPLLSHALLATWERRRGRTFTLDGYHASGGVRSAIAETAESVFTDQLNQEQQILARDVFLRLTELGEGTEDTRRRAALNELVRQAKEATQLRGVLNTLAEARLITLNEDSAEVAHEALIREWQRLHEWLTQDREGLRLHRHLTESALEWEARGRDAGELYRGARLAQSHEWAASNEERLNESERSFLKASLEEEQHDALERESRRQRELEAAQMLARTEAHASYSLRRRAMYLAISLGLAGILALVAIFFGRNANENAQLAQANANARATAQSAAEVQTQLAQSRELAAAALANLNADPERSILLALQAVHIADTNQAVDALHQSIISSHLLMTLRGHTDQALSVAFTPDGKRLVSASLDGSWRVWDSRRGSELLKIEAPAGDNLMLINVAVSPDGAQLATCGADGFLRVWDLSSGRQIWSALSDNNGATYSVVFSPNGLQIATGGDEEVVRFWDASSGQMLAEFLGHEGTITKVAFSMRGDRLVSSSFNDNVTRVWDLTNGKTLLTVPGETSAISPDGGRIVAWDSQTPTGPIVWDVATGEKQASLPGHTNVVYTLAFSLDGSKIASVSLDGTARLWDATSGQNLLVLRGHTLGLSGVAFSPDGFRLATAGDDGTIRVWDIGASHEVLTIPTERGNGRMDFSPDGKNIAMAFGSVVGIWDSASGKARFVLQGFPDRTNQVHYSVSGKLMAGGSRGGMIKLWNPETAMEIKTIDGRGDEVFGLAISPDGKFIAAGIDTGTVAIWNVSSGQEKMRFDAHKDSVFSIAFSPDGQRFVTGSADHHAAVWDLASGAKVFELSSHTDVVWGVAYSHDGKTIATASRDGTAKLWDAETGRELKTLSGHTSTVVTIAFSPDDSKVATASRDGTVKIWNTGSGLELLTLYGDGTGLNGVTFSPDGQHIASGSGSGIRIYTLNLDELLAIARSRVTRTLTPEECFNYLGLESCPLAP